jgi:uncharacterized protein
MDTLSAPEKEVTEIAEKPNDVKAKTPMEHWLRRQFPAHTLRGMLEALRLMGESVPVPYIAFYGRDLTGGLKSADLFRLLDAKADWEELFRRQQHMLQEIQAQGKLTDELKLQIERSSDLDRLEDLYAPFKLKRQTLGVQARDAGLGALADYLWKKGHNEETEELAGDTLEAKAAAFVKAESKFTDASAVLKGVQDILVERVAESFELRSLVRSTVFRRSKIRSAKGSKAKPNSKYAKFFEYQEPIGSLKKSGSSHRYLAMRKGWMEDELVLSFERPDEGVLLEKFEEFACSVKESIGAELLVQAARLALKGSVYTVMENEAHRHLKEEAEQHVIEMLSENLRKKLLRAGFGRKAVVGIDPGSVSHPCALALVDSDGKLILNLSMKFEEITDSAKQEFLQSLTNLKIQAIAVAHAPRAKEVRDGLRKMLAEGGVNLPIVSVHEHSANIYASSPAGKEEFPQLDMNTRRAVFVARYLQDPLSVFLRLDPKFLSLGEMQHEVNQSKMRAALARAMELSVNFVGADPNHAPAHVLSRIAGLDAEVAKEILQAREQAPFKNREDLKRIPALARKFEYAAGFLRFENSDEPLDRGFIPPKCYASVKAFLAKQGATPGVALTPEQLAAFDADSALQAELGPVLASVIRYELERPGEDPRGTFASFEYDPELKALSDLKPATAYPGVITNVTSFGAFVDIGIEQDGLVHISELSGNPFDSLFPGDPVTVWVSNVNAEKKQISLTMKAPGGGARRPRGDRPARSQQRAPRRPREGTAPALAGAEGAAAAPGQGENRPPRGGDRRPRDRFRGRDGERAAGGGEGRPAGERQARDGGGAGRPDRGERKPREDRKPKKPMRDSKTGAIVKFEDHEKERSSGGPRLQTKAKPHTFNPFANLANILKDKGKDGE